MNYDHINELSFDDVKYGDSRDDKLSNSRFTDSFAKKKCDYARTGLVAWHPPGTHISRYRWEPREIWFYTNNETQVLEITIQSPQSMSDGLPRFYLHRIDSNEIGWVRGVAHRQRDSDDWTDLDKTTDNAPPHTRFIRLYLRLSASTTDIRTSFKFSVYARDRDFSYKEINCDPLVGNDPPKGGDFG